jgi:hypothetical protein
MVLNSNGVVMFKYVIVIAVCSVLCACGFVKGSSNKTVDFVIDEVNEHCPQDSVIEQAAEAVIEDTTGIIVDFSPQSPDVEKE